MSTTNNIVDPEKKEKMKQICELLIAAGYARARIPSLSDLDKILGGITWALTSSFYEVEFEFKDDMTLGEKIRVSEKIAKGLKLAKCPININPIQINGLDIDVIYNVIQWLVKFVHETRTDKYIFTKKNALNYCETININKKNVLNELNNSDQNSIYIDTKHNYLIKTRELRTSRKVLDNLTYNEELRIYLILLEYGVKKDLAFQKKLIELLKTKKLLKVQDNNSKNGTLSVKKSSTSDETNKNIESIELESILDTVTESIESYTKSSNSISSNELGNKIQNNVMENLFSNNMENIVSLIEEYEKSYNNNEADNNNKFDRLKCLSKEKERLNTIKLNIIEQINTYKDEIQLIENLLIKDKYKLNEINEQIHSSELQKENNKKQIEILQNELNEDNLCINNKSLNDKLKDITDKINKKENLKEEISKFKAFCKEERISLESKLENMEKKQEKINNEESISNFNEIDLNYKLEMQNLLEKKASLFEENKVINILTRKIQVNPSKLELIQYQKRFQELYNQINLINEKNREILNEINSKQEVEKLLKSKLDTFNNLKSVYYELKTKKDKENFKTSLENILTSVTESSMRSSDRLVQLNKELEEIKDELMNKQEYEQVYMKLVKEYNREYNKIYSNIN